MRVSDSPRPVQLLTDRELVEEIAGHMRQVTALLEAFRPILAGLLTNDGQALSYTRVAGMRRALKRGAAAGNGANHDGS